MTTAITIDACAGWSVEVVTIQVDTVGNQTDFKVHKVEAGSKLTIYIHSHQQIASIKELKGS